LWITKIRFMQRIDVFHEGKLGNVCRVIRSVAEYTSTN